MGTPLMRRKNAWPTGRSHLLPTSRERQAATVLVALGRHNSIQFLNGGIITDGNFTLSVRF
jgi:hypothetical protein